MSPDKRGRAGRRPVQKSTTPTAQTRPSPDDYHDVVYFRRPIDGSIPAREYLRGLPVGVRAKFSNVLIAVAKAPPKRFAGGGYWEAMHGEMTGWFEVRCDGKDRTHHRLFCRLDYDAQQRDKPLLVVIAGASKPFQTTLSQADYDDVKKLGEEYLAANPRSIA